MPDMRRFSLSLAPVLLVLMASSSAGSFAAAPAEVAPSPARTLDLYDELLERYVTPEGVRYDAWRAKPDDSAALTRVVEKLRSIDPDILTAPDRYALYINLYNATVLELVLRERPKESIRDLSKGVTGFGIFFREMIPFDGKVISLDQLEDRLRRESRDPRIHFAVNCASASCPPIAQQAYRGEWLDDQLDRATREFLASPGAIEIESTGRSDAPVWRLRISKIFKWYGGDFKSAGGVGAFLERYAPADVSELLRRPGTKVKLSYQEYDWSLNSAP